jgi:hypothetical protein
MTACSPTTGGYHNPPEAASVLGSGPVRASGALKVGVEQSYRSSVSVTLACPMYVERAFGFTPAAIISERTCARLMQADRFQLGLRPRATCPVEQRRVVERPVGGVAESEPVGPSAPLAPERVRHEVFTQRLRDRHRSNARA